MKGLGQEFKEFILRGNVVSLAVAVIIGTAFTAVVTAMSEFIIMPIIAFLIIALIVFFMIVKPMNALMERSRNEPPADPTLNDCPFCLNAVPISATRCGHCTSELSGAVV